MDKKWLIYIGLVLLGAIASDKIRTIPVIGPKLPTI